MKTKLRLNIKRRGLISVFVEILLVGADNNNIIENIGEVKIYLGDSIEIGPIHYLEVK